MRISPAESRILGVLWQANRPTTADEVIARLGKGRGWSPGTVRTFLARLVQKKVVGAQRDGRRYLYRPLISYADYAHTESRKLIDRLFNGRIAPFITQFSERQDLSRDEIAELKRLIAKLDRER
jgi:predicted transcriptional regulator